MILDEATAYTDPENEATIVDADQIVVVNDGRVEAAGTQAELLQSCPLYETLWNAHIASRDSAEGGGAHA